MTKSAATVTAKACLIALCLCPIATRARADDQMEIRALEERFAKAFNAKDVDALMKNYVPDESLIVFDLVPPLQYVGAKSYRDNWEHFFPIFKEGPHFEMRDLVIETDRSLAFSHSIQHVSGTDQNGNAIDLTVRATDAYRKIDGHWLIVHEHISFPVDLKTGKAILTEKP
jgi:uncharacterized protein (TIGR02246 family)